MSENLAVTEGQLPPSNPDLDSEVIVHHVDLNASPRASTARWYILSVHSGAENSIGTQIQNMAEVAGCSDLFENFSVPSIIKQTAKGPRKVLPYPGYLFIRMTYNETSADVIKKIPRTRDFLKKRREAEGAVRRGI